MRGLFQKSIIQVALEGKIRFNKQIQGRATKILHCEGGEALEKIAQRGCRCPIPACVQGQAGWSFRAT